MYKKKESKREKRICVMVYGCVSVLFNSDKVMGRGMVMG